MAFNPDDRIFIGPINNPLAVELAAKGEPRTVSLKMSPGRQSVASRSVSLCIFALIALVLATLAHDASFQKLAAIIAIGAALANTIAHIGYRYTPEQRAWYWWSRFRRSGNIIEVHRDIVKVLEEMIADDLPWTHTDSQAFFQRHAVETYAYLRYMREIALAKLPTDVAFMYVRTDLVKLVLSEYGSELDIVDARVVQD